MVQARPTYADGSSEGSILPAVPRHGRGSAWWMVPFNGDFVVSGRHIFRLSMTPASASVSIVWALCDRRNWRLTAGANEKSN
jgi:hypothetical protein